MDKHFAIAITRECGAGGSTVGRMLAEDFGIHLYDRKLLQLASEDSGINEKVFAQADENTRKSALYMVSRSIWDGKLIPPESGDFLSDKNLFNYQAKILRGLLDTESFVCIGRAADFILKDKPNVISVFLDAPYEWRIEREMKRQGIDRSHAIQYIDRFDKYRGSYYVYHTGLKWRDLTNYTMCINTAQVGMEGSAALIEETIRLKCGITPENIYLTENS